MGIAVHNHHDTKDKLPAHGWPKDFTSGQFVSASVNGGERMHGVDVYSAHIALLPFIEQTALFDEVCNRLAYAASINDNDSKYTPRPWDWKIVNENDEEITGPFGRMIDYFICPSDNAGLTDSDIGQLGRTNYRVNNFGDSSAPWEWYGRGFFCSNHIGADQSPHLGERNFTAILDGLSNTIMLSEGCISVHNDTRYKSAQATYDTFPDNIIPSDCAMFRGLNGQIDTAAVSGGGTWSGKGHRWADARQVYTGFNTILPPNAPSCGRPEAEWFSLSTPSSYHSGGVNACLGDGAVRFISETIDCGIQTQHLGPAGHSGYCRDLGTPSTYGVWGALGSRAAGEPNSL
jgi:hypothetical protein